VQLLRTHLSDGDLQRQRVALRRDLRRASTAAILILLVVVVLALAAIFEASQSDGHARRADQERARAEQELWNASLAQARAERLSGQVGHRTRGLAAVAVAAKIRPSLELRNEAIAGLASMDLVEQTWRGAPLSVECSLLDPTLERFAWADTNGCLHILGLATGQEVSCLPAVQPRIQGAQLSPDGRLVAVRCQDGSLVVWELGRQQTLLRTNVGAAAVQFSMGFTADSRQLVVLGVAPKVRLYDLGSGQESQSISLEGQPAGFCCHPRAALLGVVVGNEVQIWDWPGPRLVRRLAHGTSVIRAAWDYAGTRVATACYNGDVCVWTEGNPQPQVFSGHTAVATGVAFNHRGDLLVSTAQDGTSRFWDLTGGKFLFSTHRGYACGFSKDDQRLAFVRPLEGIGIWRVVEGTGYRVIPVWDGPERNLWSTDVSRDGRLLAVVKADGLRLLEAATGNLLARAPIPEAKAAWFTPEGENIVASGADGISVWPLLPDAKAGGERRSLGPPRRFTFPDREPLQRCELSLDGRKVVAGVGRQAAVLLDLGSPGPPVWFEDPAYFGYRDETTISPDGQWVATGTFHGSGTRVWNARTGELVRHLGGRSASVAFSPDSQWLVAAASDEYRFWRTANWERGKAIPRDAIGELPGYAAFTRDGKLMAIAKSHRLVQLIEPGSGHEVASLQAPDPQMITWLRFDPEGNTLAVSTGLGLLQLWDLRTLRRELAAFGLDWGPRVSAAEAGGGGAVRVSLGRSRRSEWASAPATDLFIWASLAGVALAMASAAVVFRWWRRLIAGYERVEATVARRSQELAQAQGELIHSQKMTALGTLAAGIAHDFNNLLSVIRMSNTLMARESQGRPEVQEELAAVERAVQQGKRVVNSMLGYTRSASEAVTDYSATEVVEDAMPMLTRQFLSGIVLTLELDRNVPLVRGARGRLEQILLNLIVNASEAMKGEGNLGIAVQAKLANEDAFVLRPRPAARYVAVVVADSGPGIAPEIRPRIFEPFFTTKQDGTTRGTGLGLSMVYSIAEQEGLGISVETMPGKGTSFTITLPAVTSERKG
jgi:signal transduction histidine kinase